MKNDINLAIAGLPCKPPSDAYFMGHWLRNSKADAFVDTGIISLQNLFPAGAPDF